MMTFIAFVSSNLLSFVFGIWLGAAWMIQQHKEEEEKKRLVKWD